MSRKSRYSEKQSIDRPYAPCRTGGGKNPVTAAEVQRTKQDVARIRWLRARLGVVDAWNTPVTFEDINNDRHSK